MRKNTKKTAPQTPKRQRASSPKQPGLIARGRNAQASARCESALDNRSHRTVMRFTCAMRNERRSREQKQPPHGHDGHGFRVTTGQRPSPD